MNGPHHDDVDERLCDWVDGRMTERERERFAAELRVNASLRQQLAEYERTVAAIRAALQAPTTPVPMADRVMAALATQQNRAAQPIVAMPWRGRSWSHLGFCAASAAALLLLALWIDSWAGRATEPLVSTSDAAQAELPMVKQNAEPAAASAAPANVGAGQDTGSIAGVAEARERLPEPTPPSAVGGRAVDGAPVPGAPELRSRDVAKPATDAEAAAKSQHEQQAADKAVGERAAVEQAAGEPAPAAPPALATPPADIEGIRAQLGDPVPGSAAGTGGLVGAKAQPSGRREPPTAPRGEPTAPRGEAGSQPVGGVDDTGPRDVAPPSPGGRGTAGPATAGPVGPGRDGSRGGPSSAAGGGGGAVAAPAADGPWPELTIVGTRPAVAELPDRSRVLLGFVAEPGEAKAKSDAKPSGTAGKSSPTELPPADLPALLAAFVRSASATPANELRWPTSGGGLVLRRLPAERSDDADTVWIADGAPDELRLLLGQVGAVANEARWRVQSGEFAPELQKRVLAAESAPATRPGTPAEPVAEATKEPVPTPAPSRGVVPAEPAAGPAARRRVVLRFRLTP